MIIHFYVNGLRIIGSNYFGSYFWSTSIDVLAEATRYFIHYRPALINLKLSTMARAVGVKVDDDNLHDALYDVYCTMKIFEAILQDGLIKKFDQMKIEELRNEMLESASESVYIPHKRSEVYIME